MTTFSRLLSIPRSRPFTFTVAYSGAKTVLADYLVQKHIEKQEKIDTTRLATFGLFGMGYLGAWQYGLQVKAFSKWFPNASTFISQPLNKKLVDKSGQAAVVKQVFIDLFVNHPLTYFPCFYIIQQTLHTGAPAGWLSRYMSNAREDLVGLWKFWVPIQCFNFSFCPMWLRVPFVATLSLAWTGVMSFKRGGETSKEKHSNTNT